MAVTSNVLIGKSSGRVGNAVFSTWKGINVLKEKPVSVANPNTDPQLMNRSAMRQSVAIGRTLFALIFLGFKKLAVKQSAFNAFISDARKNAFNYTNPPDATLIPSSIRISKGSISETALTSVVTDVSDGETTVVFPATAALPGQSVSDKVLVAAYNQNNNAWSTGSALVLRSAGTAVIDMPTGTVAGDTVICFVGFYNQLTGEASDSTNINSVAIA